MGNGSALEVVLHDDALYKSTTLLYLFMDLTDGSDSEWLISSMNLDYKCSNKVHQNKIKVLFYGRISERIY